MQAVFLFEYRWFDLTPITKYLPFGWEPTAHVKHDLTGKNRAATNAKHAEKYKMIGNTI